MFETTFSHASASPIPTSLSSASPALSILHDFETVIRLSPDCRGCKQIHPPNGKTKSKTNGASTPTKTNGATVNGTNTMTYWEVEDDLPFMPKKLWQGGVKYTADFLPCEDGCDITVHAPGGFTSTNHWRIIRETAPLNTSINDLETHPRDEKPSQLTRTGTRDMHHAETQGAGWYVQIISDARCPRAFAGFVKGFLQNSHVQLQHAFIEHLEVVTVEEKMAGMTVDVADVKEIRPPVGERRPTLGRRRSTKY